MIYTWTLLRQKYLHFLLWILNLVQLVNPGNLKEFALGITNYVSATGDLKAGFAVEWAPFMTFNKNTGNWENKSDNKNKFEWKNWTTSIATTNDSTNVKLAGAIRFSPIDRTNPLNDKEWVDSISTYFYYIVNQREFAEEKVDNTRQMFTEKNIQYFNKYRYY